MDVRMQEIPWDKKREAKNISNALCLLKSTWSDKSDNSLVKDEDLLSSIKIDAKLEELERQQEAEEVSVVRSGKQILRRSNVIAKQVISISSALSFGFVSQLWVDPNSVSFIYFFNFQALFNSLVEEFNLNNLLHFIPYNQVI
ncbi:uncharacterized protein Fot_24186 [Forsythia ovata]|uniref:Uncharacterized protein n=1 Tax=Forsythia ovata TaxID=205694 RepID=A0ABD1U6K0_9LAMI